MDLSRAGRDFFTLELSAVDSHGVAVTDLPYEASFDGGDTWVSGSKDPATGYWEWLLEGPIADASVDLNGATIAATITARTQPIVRVVDSPKIIAADTPLVNLY